MFKSLFKSAKSAVAVAVQEEIPAEVIHAEVDAQEEAFLNQVKAIIAQKNSSTVSIDEKELRKTNLLSELGFGNSELIKDVTAKKEVNEKLAKEAKLLEQSVDLFESYKRAYPLEKIMPFENFEKVLKKYSLIYAPSQAYIKDVPEKNLMEIKNAKATNERHYAPDMAYLSNLSINYSYNSGISSNTESLITKEIIKALSDHPEKRFFNKHRYSFKSEESFYQYEANNYLKEFLSKNTSLGSINEDKYYFSSEFEFISRKGLFIAAPKNHFDLSNLTQVDDYAFYAKIKELKVVFTKDPIAFHILAGNEQYPQGFVRILSKWGSENDKSYLDPEVQHGLMN